MTEPASSSSLFTDLYELTMAAAYREAGMDGVATFELFVRSLPAERRFLVVAGLEEVLGYLESFRFGEDDLSYLATVGVWPDGFLDDLATWRFDGDVWAMPEGEVAYAGEPLVRVTARSAGRSAGGDVSAEHGRIAHAHGVKGRAGRARLRRARASRLLRQARPWH